MFALAWSSDQQPSLQVSRFDTTLPTYRQSKETDLSLLIKAYQPQIDEMNKRRTCVVCRAEYKPADNFLGYGCRTHRSEFGLDGRWTCCRNRAGHLGCMASIHTSMPETAHAIHRDYVERKLQIPIEIVDFGLIHCNKKLFEDYVETPSLRDPTQRFYHMPCVLQYPQ